MRKFIAGLSMLAVGLLGTTVVADAQSPGESLAPASGERSAGVAAAGSFSICDGGAQEGVVQNLQNLPTTVNEGGFVTITSGTIPALADGDSDTITVTLTGEAFLGATGSVNDDIDVQLLIDGVVVQPAGPITFHSGVQADAHAAMWCKRLTPGNHTAQVQARVLDSSPFAVVQGFIDDYVVRVERSN